jgi:hypothetical protein
MTWKDKLEIGLKDDAPFRRDNLPDFQTKKGGPETRSGDSTRSPEEPGARQDAVEARRIAPPTNRARPRPTTRATVRPTKRVARKRR